MPHRLYTDLAPWYPLLTPAHEYEGEAAAALEALTAGLGRPPRELLELGAGAGHLASHLHMRRTLVDLSPAMLEHSRRLNPDAEHHVGDMRVVRLGRTFDAVLIHDAIMYMTTRADLLAALRTARDHLVPGGVAYVMPDFVEETYAPGTDTGGEDGEGRALRYLEWNHPHVPGESTVKTDFVLVLKEGDAIRETLHDRHVVGIFPRDTWLAVFREAGFSSVEIRPDEWRADNFLALV